MSSEITNEPCTCDGAVAKALREERGTYPDDAVICGNCGESLSYHPLPELPCAPKFKTAFVRAGKCGYCELLAVVNGTCDECGAKEE